MSLFRRFIVVCFCIFGAVSCVGTHQHINHPPAPEIKKPTHKTIVFHTDTSFTDRERRMLEEVATYVSTQSSGILTVEYVYDLNVNDEKSLKLAETNDILVRTTSKEDFIKGLDGGGGVVLGLTYVDLEIIDMDQHTRVFIVVDRLKFPVVFEHVVFHEILHAFRFKHLNDKNAIMFWATHGEFPSLCMNKTDVQELCRIYECKNVKINYCQ